MDHKKFSFSDRIKSFGYAFNGLYLFFTTEHNGRIHVVAALIAIGTSFLLRISAMEWVAILSVICAVFVAEIFNTALEKLADVVSPDIHPQIKRVKDLAAGAVLLVAILAVAIALIIFLPKLF